MLKLLFLFALPTITWAFKDKTTDEEYNTLTPLKEVPVGCNNAKNDYALVDGKLEKCSKFLAESGTKNHEDDDYEKYKCKHLRVHGQLDDQNKCVCNEKYQGATCNEYIGCPEGFTLYNRVCASQCRHNGTIAFSQRGVECICKAPWDGRFCDRLACWRMAPKEHERRWRNAGDKCECNKNLTGEYCDIVTGCENGELSGGRCICVEGYKGETCALKCTPGVTCGSCSQKTLLSVLISLLFVVGAQLLR
ncbi:EGF-like domain protein [Aphelenchoides bicaudatus]|nr:EGF-like domain protein [Aphelenchoides bicaudatus]